MIEYLNEHYSIQMLYTKLELHLKIANREVKTIGQLQQLMIVV